MANDRRGTSVECVVEVLDRDECMKLLQKIRGGREEWIYVRKGDRADTSRKVQSEPGRGLQAQVTRTGLCKIHYRDRASCP